MPVVTLTGPRQSGKTTLLREEIPGYSYLNLEAPDLRDFARSDPRGFLATHQSKLIIDEAQNAPQLFSQIQVAVDESRENGQFILSGSHNFLLMDQISQSLAGRTSIFNLLPFSLSELQQAGITFDVFEAPVYKGLYPRIYDHGLEPDEWYPDYIQTYIERDVRTIFNVRDLSTFQKFVRICAGRVGQVLNLSSIANDLGINYKTVKSWISVLEASFIVFLLQPYHRNFNKRLIKSPKLYFYDTGLACALLGIHNQEQLNTHFLRGGLFESFIISELSKTWLNSGRRPPLFFWRDNTGNEVDCIMEVAGDPIPIEIKSARTVAQDFFKGVNYFNRIAGRKDKPSYIIYGGDNVQKRTAATVLPWNAVPEIVPN